MRAHVKKVEIWSRTSQNDVFVVDKSTITPYKPNWLYIAIT